jgi:hypothetical protein
MRFSYRTIFKIALLATATIVAGARLAHGQAVNPIALDFQSVDHAHVNSYEVCFYPSATSSQAIRCNSVPVTQVQQRTGGVLRIARDAWSANLPFGTDLFPRIKAIGNNSASAEVAPAAAPFFFRFHPRPVTDVTLVP